MRCTLLLGVLVIALPAQAQVREQLDDLRLATAVRLALVADPMTRPLDVEVVARRGTIELTSEAGGRAREVLRVAQAVRGVRAVTGLGLDADRPQTPTVTLSDRPAREEPPLETDGPVFHTVQRGETLFGLARQYDTTLDAILALNNRQSTAIRVGERIRVR